MEGKIKRNVPALRARERRILEPKAQAPTVDCGTVVVSLELYTRLFTLSS
jgi:hypothetical protein